MITPDTYLDARDLGADSLSPDISADVHSDGTTVTLRWVERLSFHTRYFDSDPAMFDTSANRDDDGALPLSESAMSALERLSAERFGAVVSADEDGGDLYAVTFSWQLDDVTDSENLSSRAYDLLYDVANQTDPGTFNRPYLMGDVSREVARP